MRFDADYIAVDRYRLFPLPRLDENCAKPPGSPLRITRRRGGNWRGLPPPSDETQP